MNNFMITGKHHKPVSKQVLKNKAKSLVQSNGEAASLPPTDATMPEPLSLVGIRHEQRRVAALLDATKQFGVVLPSRQDGIPFEDLYKSEYYLQMQAGLGQMKITGTQQQSAISLPEIGDFVKTQGNEASKLWTLDKADKTSTTVLSLDSTQKGWKQIQDVRQRRESYKKRKQLKTERGTGAGSGKRLHDSADGAVGWSPDQATRELRTRKKIRADRELSRELSSRRYDEKSTPSVNHSDIRSGKRSNYSTPSVDYRLPKRVAKPGRLAPNGTELAPNGTEHNGNGGSIYGKPLLRYNHDNKGADLNLSQRSPNTRSTLGSEVRVSNHLSYSGFLEGNDRRDSPFYPIPPSVSPSSSCSDYEFDLSGRNYNITPADERDNPGVHTGAEEGYVKSEALTSYQGMNHTRSRNGGNDLVVSDAAATTRRGDNGVVRASMPNHPSDLPVLSTRYLPVEQRRRESELAVNAYRDAYTRALAVARSRRLPDDFTGLGTRTTPAYTFSYFTHVPTCKCQTCLDRIFRRDSVMKTSRMKKRKKPQGLKLILGDVELEDYYR